MLTPRPQSTQPVADVSQQLEILVKAVSLTCSLARKNAPAFTSRQEKVLSQAESANLGLSRSCRSIGLQVKTADDVEPISAGLVRSHEHRPLSNQSKQSGPSTKILKEVMIPPTGLKMSSNRRRVIPASQTPSSDESALSSILDQSMEYDTPGTSITATPAEPLSKEALLAETSRKSGRGRPLGNPPKFGLRGQQQHQDLLGDALLAQALQEAEYNEDELKQSVTKRRRRAPVEDSDDEDLNLTDLNTGISLIDLPASKKQKTNGRLSLPTRAARESARKSIAEKSNHEIMDTDSGESNLSEYDSEEGLDDFEGSDVSDDRISAFAIAETDAIPPTATLQQIHRRPTRPRRHRNLPAPPVLDRNWQARSRGSMRVRSLTYQAVFKN